MTEKILCPWCGAEMEFEFTLRGQALARTYQCPKCGACSPKIVRNCLEKRAEELDKETEAAALRRYTPLIKPMTIEDIMRVRYETAAFWIEFAGTYKEEPACHWYLWSGLLGYSAKVVGYCEPWFLPMADYGKTWRCWERKPTDEERGAAGWEK